MKKKKICFKQFKWKKIVESKEKAKCILIPKNALTLEREIKHRKTK